MDKIKKPKAITIELFKNEAQTLIQLLRGNKTKSLKWMQELAEDIEDQTKLALE